MKLFWGAYQKLKSVKITLSNQWKSHLFVFKNNVKITLFEHILKIVLTWQGAQPFWQGAQHTSQVHGHAETICTNASFILLFIVCHNLLWFLSKDSRNEETNRTVFVGLLFVWSFLSVLVAQSRRWSAIYRRDGTLPATFNTHFYLHIIIFRCPHISLTTNSIDIKYVVVKSSKKGNCAIYEMACTGYRHELAITLVTRHCRKALSERFPLG